MAVVPNDEVGTVQQEPLPGRAIPRFSDEANPSEFGAGLGQGLEAAANDVNIVNRQQAAQQKQLQDKANADADRVQLAGAITNLSKARDQIQFGKDDNDPNAAFRQTGQALATLPERYGSQFDEAAAQISSTLTPHQQAMFAERVAGEKDSLDLQMRRYQFEQSNREAIETFSNAKSQVVQSASNNYRDPAATVQAREDLFNAGMALAARGGKDSITAYKASGYAHDLDQLHEGVIGAYLADNKVQGAQRYLNQWASDLSSVTVKDTLENRIRAAGDRLDALQKDTSRDRIMDQQKAAAAGLPGWEKLAAPSDYQIVHKNDAQRQQDFTQKLALAGTAEKRFDTMSIPAIDAYVQSTKPTEAKPGVAKDLQVQKFIEQAAKNSKDRRAADPANFAVTSGAWHPLDFSDPKAASAELSTRSNTAPQLSQQLGVRMPLLSKPEARQLSSSLDNLSANQKIQALTALHQSLPNERAYFSVLQQVMPHSPVTSIVGQKIDAPNEWDAPSWYDPTHGPKQADGEKILAGEMLLNPPKKEGDEKHGFKGGFPMPADTNGGGLRSYFANNTRDIFNSRPQLADAHYAAFRDAYASLSAEEGDYSGEYKGTRAEKALSMAVGTPVRFNDGHVVPPNGMDPNKFEGVVRQIVAAQAKAAGAPADFEKRIDGYQLREVGAVGSGRYELVNGNVPLIRPDKKGPFVIDLQAQ